MKLRVKLLSAILLSALSVTNLYALQPTEISDTFTFENAKDTMAGHSDTTYIITSTNNLKVKGSLASGVEDLTLAKTYWKDVVTNKNGMPIENIIKIKHTYGQYNSILTLDKDGNAYVIWNPGGFPLKINEDKKIVDIDVTSGNNGGNYAFNCFLLDENGKLYSYRSKLDEVSIDEKIIDIEASTYASGVVLAHTENGNVYYYNRTLAKKTMLTDVSKIYGTSGSSMFLVRYTDGRHKLYDLAKDTTQEIKFVGGSDNPLILNAVTDINLRYSLLITTDGVYKLSGSTATKTNITQTPVDITGNTVLCTDGKYYKLVDNSGVITLELRDDMDKISVWGNENPIIPYYDLVNFNIDYNQIFKRETDYDIEFSMVTNKKPEKFNIYYVKAVDMNKPDSKVLIETNVPYNSLNPTEYDTGYLDAKGNPILGKTYTYNWTIGDQDLTNIQLVIEPIYQ